ncbi:hypothetical protein C8F04DRAFT_1186875 [Mycena alexandri]|uniref:Uncharacterized protein n=1 Tax=Mycena alexandri TaxID=1745969 RepID=A0AAD6SMM0_9AGAR|nr:hypothetical protein C8F04DRAFT_1186875 [Mycena alexandri]
MTHSNIRVEHKCAADPVKVQVNLPSLSAKRTITGCLTTLDKQKNSYLVRWTPQFIPDTGREIPVEFELVKGVSTYDSCKGARSSDAMRAICEGSIREINPLVQVWFQVETRVECTERNGRSSQRRGANPTFSIVSGGGIWGTGPESTHFRVGRDLDKALNKTSDAMMRCSDGQGDKGQTRNSQYMQGKVYHLESSSKAGK